MCPEPCVTAHQSAALPWSPPATIPLLAHQEFNAKLSPSKDVRESPKAMAKLRKQASGAGCGSVPAGWGVRQAGRILAGDITMWE